MKKDKDYYQIKVKCNNCSYGNSIWSSGTGDEYEVIEKGIPVDQVLGKRECPHCGCNTLSKTV